MSEEMSEELSDPQPIPGGIGSSEETEKVDAPRFALNRMRQAAQARGDRPQRKQSSGLQGSAARGSGRGGRNRRRSGSGQQTGRDPQELGGVVSRMISERGWAAPVAVGSVITRWDVLVGPEIAAHCQPESFTGTKLQVRCDSTSWATQLRLLSSTLLQRFDKELGAGVVTVIHVLGPAAPNWAKGARRVNGRGPRDTYG